MSGVSSNAAITLKIGTKTASTSIVKSSPKEDVKEALDDLLSTKCTFNVDPLSKFQNFENFWYLL